MGSSGISPVAEYQWSVPYQSLCELSSPFLQADPLWPFTVNFKNLWVTQVKEGIYFIFCSLSLQINL